MYCSFDGAVVDDEITDSEVFVPLTFDISPEFFVVFVFRYDFIYVGGVGVSATALGDLFDFFIFLF